MATRARMNLFMLSNGSLRHIRLELLAGGAVICQRELDGCRTEPDTHYKFSHLRRELRRWSG